jgi:hypothetical protein
MLIVPEEGKVLAAVCDDDAECKQTGERLQDRLENLQGAQ